MCWLEDHTSKAPRSPPWGPPAVLGRPQARGKASTREALGSELCFLTLALRCDRTPSLWVLLIMRTAGPAALGHTPDFTQCPG